jgi:hypothetical protein
LLDAGLLSKNENYNGKVRAYINIDRLPTPLKLLAYVSPGWQLSSDWYVWPITQ